MKSKPFVIKPDKSSYPLVPIQPDANKFSESWLQEMLHNHPQILPVDEIEPVFWPLVSIGREVSTNVGFIDLLLISKAGYPVIVETKLWRNNEAKREVLAQAIDYAGELSKWSFEKLNRECQKNTNKGVIGLIQSTFDPDRDELPSEDDIAKNLRLGRFLILVVSDQIRNSLIGMLNYINRYPHLATNVGLVELKCFLLPESDQEILVVPSIVAQTEIVERSIVQINISPNLDHQLSVEQIKSKPDAEGGALSEDAYWQVLGKNAPTSVPLAKTLLDHFGKYDEILLKLRKSAIVLRMSLPDSEQRLSLFLIGVDGTLECWVSTVTSQLENAGYDRQLGEDYEKELSRFLKQRRGKLSIYSPIENIDLDAFIAVVDHFRDKVLKAESLVKE